MSSRASSSWRRSSAVKLSELRGRRVLIVGGGNVAMDAARTARRLGASETIVAYRRGRDEMPAYPEEVHAAESEGVLFNFQVAPIEVRGDEHGHVIGLRCVRTALGEPDTSGRRRPEPVAGSEFVIACEIVIVAAGLRPDATALARGLQSATNGAVKTAPGTLQTDVPYVFAAGDVVSGALDIAHAVGQGQRAASMIDRWLNGAELDGENFDVKLPVVAKNEVLARVHPARRQLDQMVPSARIVGAPRDFAEVEPPLSEEEARYGAERCLDCGPCSECGECVAVCEADAIDFTMREREVEVEVGTIVLATGFTTFDPLRIPEYGYGTYPNVYTSLEVERLLNASGPTQGEMVLRDGGEPRSVGIIHCVGSRDVRHNAYCSRVCCMYSIKLAHLIKERTGAEVFNFYIDMHALRGKPTRSSTARSWRRACTSSVAASPR